MTKRIIFLDDNDNSVDVKNATKFIRNIINKDGKNEEVFGTIE
jgi:hypothetical protein